MYCMHVVGSLYMYVGCRIVSWKLFSNYNNFFTLKLIFSTCIQYEMDLDRLRKCRKETLGTIVIPIIRTSITSTIL